MTKWLIAGGAGLTGLMLLVAITGAVAGSAPATTGAGYGASALALKDIPPDFLALYQAVAAQEGLDWTIIAGVGKVETDHGRLDPPCATSSAGARGPMQFMPGTWEGYGEGGDICNPVDAIPAAARLLKANGAPKDYQRAIFAYNHSDKYVHDVLVWAERYRGDVGGAGGGGHAVAWDPSATWLMPVPGTSAICDRRIVPDVVWILETYHAAAGDCYAPSGHAAGGEHPLGLGIDLVPGPGGSWDLLDKLAHDMGWRESCASTGCADRMPKPFRFIGWDGFPNHGRGNHIHLSWDHGPGRPVETVYTLR